MAIIHDALSDGTTLPFVEMCLQRRVGRATCHSIKKLERDIKSSFRKATVQHMEIHALKGSAIHLPPGGKGVAWFLALNLRKSVSTSPLVD